MNVDLVLLVIIFFIISIVMYTVELHKAVRLTSLLMDEDRYVTSALEDLQFRTRRIDNTLVQLEIYERLKQEKEARNESTIR